MIVKRHKIPWQSDQGVEGRGKKVVKSQLENDFNFPIREQMMI